MDKLRKWFQYVNDQWLDRLVRPDNAPLVTFLDATVGSSCKYCMATRSLIFGIGVGIWNWAGVALSVSAVALTLGEKYLLKGNSHEEPK